MSTATLVVTIASGIISTDLVAYHLHLDMSQFPSDFWDIVAADGGDMRARSLTGATAYPIDILDIDTSAHTGHCFVLVPIQAAGNQFRIDFGDTSASLPLPGSPIHWLKVWAGYGPVWAMRAGATEVDECWRRPDNWSRVKYPSVDIVGSDIYLGGGFLRAGSNSPPNFSQRSGGWIGRRTQGAGDGAAWSNAGDLTVSTDRETLMFRSNGKIGLWNNTDGWIEGGAWINGHQTALGYSHDSTVERNLYQDGALLAHDATTFSLPSGGNYKYVGVESNALTMPLTAKFQFAYMVRQLVSDDWFAFEFANWFHPATTLSYSVINFTEYLNMSILFAGTSIADFNTSGGPSAYTSTNKDTNVAEGFSCTSSADIKCSIDLTAGEDDFWIGGYLQHTAGSGATASGLSLWNTTHSTAHPLFQITADTGSNTMKAYYWNGTALTLFDTSGVSEVTLSRIDVHCKIADSGGVFEVYVNGVLDMDFTSVGSDTKLTSAADIDRFSFGCIGVGTTVWSGIVIADEDTRGLRLVQRLPNAAGAETQWTGAYTDIDETGFNDVDYITVGTANQTSTFGFADLPSEFANSPIAAVILSGRMQGSAVSPTTLQGVARVDGTDYVDDMERIVPTSFGAAQVIFAQNPETLTEWTATTVNASEFGVKSKT